MPVTRAAGTPWPHLHHARYNGHHFLFIDALLESLDNMSAMQ